MKACGGAGFLRVKAPAVGSSPRTAVALAVASLTLLAPSTAAAAKPDARACAAARDAATKLRAGKHLREAREPLATCSAASCPADVRRACTKAAADVDAAMPTVAFTAKDPSGAEVSAVKVTIDGQPADAADGDVLQIDPGKHELTFTADPWAPVTRTLTLAEGNRRTETVTFAKAPAAAPPADAAPAPAPDLPPTGEGPGMTQKTAGMITGGLGLVGVAGVGLGSVFGLLAINARNLQTSDCASAAKCANHPSALNDHSTSLSDGTISTAAFIVGGAFIAGAVGFYLVENHPSATGAATGVLVVPGLGGVSVQGSF